MGLKEKSKTSKVKSLCYWPLYYKFSDGFKWLIYRSTCFFRNLDQPNATVRFRVGNPKGIDTKPNLYLLFTRMLDFFFLIKILFTSLLAYTFTTQKFACTFFFRVFESHWFVSSGKKSRSIWKLQQFAYNCQKK